MGNPVKVGRSRLAVLAVVLAANQSGVAAAATSTLPPTPIREVKEEHFGTEVSDPYRWLEDTKNPEVVTWLKSEHDYTRAALDALPELAGRRAYHFSVAEALSLSTLRAAVRCDAADP